LRAPSAGLVPAPASLRLGQEALVRGGHRTPSSHRGAGSTRGSVERDGKWRDTPRHAGPDPIRTPECACRAPDARRARAGRSCQQQLRLNWAQFQPRLVPLALDRVRLAFAGWLSPRWAMRASVHTRWREERRLTASMRTASESQSSQRKAMRDLSTCGNVLIGIGCLRTFLRNCRQVVNSKLMHNCVPEV
jgi:hypothetical protein